MFFDELSMERRGEKRREEKRREEKRREEKRREEKRRRCGNNGECCKKWRFLKRDLLDRLYLSVFDFFTYSLQGSNSTSVTHPGSIVGDRLFLRLPLSFTVVVVEFT